MLNPPGSSLNTKSRLYVLISTTLVTKTTTPARISRLYDVWLFCCNAKAGYYGVVNLCVLCAKSLCPLWLKIRFLNHKVHKGLHKVHKVELLTPHSSLIPSPPHSNRNALTGCKRAARMAGNTPDSTAMASEPATTLTIISGSSRVGICENM